MKFNPKYIYAQSIILNPNYFDTQQAPEIIFWATIQVYAEKLKEIIPTNYLSQVEWEIIPYLPGKEDLYAELHKDWRVLVWRYTPKKEKANERV